MIVAVVTLLVTQRERLAFGVRYVQARLTPKATVEDRLRSYESAARQRLEPALQLKGFSYPLKKLHLARD